MATPRDPDAGIDQHDALAASSLEAERAILCAMLLSAEAIREARGLVQVRHFYRSSHALIFEALLAIADRDEEPGLTQLAEELRARGRFDQVGGAVAIAGLTEAVGSAANLKPLAKIVRERAVRRAAAAQGLRLVEASGDPARPIEAVLAEHRKAAKAIVEEHGAIDRQAWMTQIMTLRELLQTEFEPIESIIGDGILTRGAYAQFAGHSSLGKTYLTIQMAASIITGQSFLGQKTNPQRVAMLEFEMPWQAMKARALRHGMDPDVLGNGIDFLCMPKGQWYFTERDTIERVVDWCGERAVRLFIVDPLNRTRRGDASDPEVASEWLDAVHEIIERTGVTLLAVNHVRKAPNVGAAASRTTTASLDSIKGDSRYVDDADTVFILDEVLDGSERLIRFEWAKSRFGAKPPSAYLKRNATGFFDVVESPTAKRKDDEDRAIQLLRDRWTEGLRLQEAMAEFGVPIDKARRLIVRVGGVARGATTDRKYFHPECLEELDPSLPGMEE